MKYKWVGMVSMRYLISNRKEKGNSSIILSVSGIAAGVMALVCVISVMNGFQLSKINRINEINSFHLRASGVKPEARDSVSRRLKDIEDISFHTFFRETSAIAYGFASRPGGCQIKGVDSRYLLEDPVLQEYMELMAGSFNLNETSHAVIGWDLARQLNLGVGDTLTLLLIRQEGGAAGPVNRDLTISGIFDCGYGEYNSTLVYINGATSLVFGESDKYILGMKLKDRFRDQKVLSGLSSLFGTEYDFVSWRDFNKAFFSALFIEKTAMYLILCLIFLVVAVNIYHSLKRSVFERSEEIALLKAIGAGPGQIRVLFLFQGLILSLTGALLGLAAGIILSLNIQPVFIFIENAVNSLIRIMEMIPLLARFSGYTQDSFYLESVDAVIMPSDIIGFFAAAVLTSLLAAFFASARVTRIRPAEIMHQE